MQTIIMKAEGPRTLRRNLKALSHSISNTS